MVRETVWLSISGTGKVTIKKNRPKLGWNEIAMKLYIVIPDEIFKRPQIEANITVKDIPNTAYNPEIIINTKELIEQQTGAKIEFRVISEKEKQVDEQFLQ